MRKGNKAKIRYIAKRIGIVLTVSLCLITLNCNLAYASTVSLADALASVDIFNSGTPFKTIGTKYSSTHAFGDATCAYETSGIYKGSYSVNSMTSFFVSPDKYATVRIPFSAPVYFVSGYTYDITFNMATQIFDNNDDRVDPSPASLQFLYLNGNTSINSAEFEPVSITPNSMDGYDVRFCFRLSDARPPISPINYHADIGAYGSYEYNHMVLFFKNKTTVVKKYHLYFFIKDFSCKRSDGDAYMSQVIVDGFAGIKDDVQQGVFDGLNQYDQSMPDVDYSDEQAALDEYGQMNNEVESMIDTDSIDDAFDIDMSGLYKGISCAGGFLTYLYENIPWYNMVIPVAVCFSALALLLGLVKNR